MAEQIQADYAKLEDVARKFQTQSHAVEDTLNQVRTRMGPLEDGGWIGRGADAFFSEMQGEVVPAMQRLRDALDEANRVVREVSQHIQQAETEASTLFRSGR